MFEIGRCITDKKRRPEFFNVKFYGFDSLSDTWLTEEAFIDFARKNEIEIIEFKKREENRMLQNSYIKVKQCGLTYILFVKEDEKFNLLCFRPILDLKLLCSLDNKESYSKWIIDFWEPNKKVLKTNCKELLYYSDIETSQFLDKVCVFKQKGKEYYVTVNKKFDEGVIEESFDLLSTEEKD